MNIQLIYYFREVNHYYYLNGPEKVNGNIVINSTAYQLSDSNAVMSKINEMIASLAPDITNVQFVTSNLYTGDIQINIYQGELVSSSGPDYTNILSAINTNLTNLNNKFISSNNNVAYLLESIFMCFNSGGINESASNKSLKSFVRYLQSLNASFQNESEESFHDYSYFRALQALSNSSLPASNSLVRSNSPFVNILNALKQSVSPNASITDVISSLNTNIHNDLTNINTTENNKDTVLIIDGQQEFKLHKDDE